MEYQSNQNPLDAFANMGFAVTWKLIDLGLDRSMDANVEAFLTETETVRFLKDVLGNNPSRTDEIIAVLCEADDPFSLRKRIRELAENEPTDRRVQLRKWRAYALQKLLQEIKDDPFGHSELIWFWSTGLSLGDRIMEDYGSDAAKINEYYSRQGAVRAIAANQAFLAAEIKELSDRAAQENDLACCSGR